MSEQKIYDMVIIGGGPAGSTAAIYAARAGLTSIIIEQMNIGGEIVSTDRLDNYPAFPEGISGAEFGMLLQKQMESLEVPVEMTQVDKVTLEGNVKQVEAISGSIAGKTVLIATGTEPNLLGVRGETELLGRGVSYCATCDAAFFRGKKVAVIGGGDAALEETIFLSRFADQVYLIHRRDQFRGCSWLQDKVMKIPSVKVLWNTTVSEIEGEKKVDGLKIKQDDQDRHLDVQGLFIYVGRKPKAGFLEGIEMERDSRGFIITSGKMETSIDGVYAAGDIRQKYLRQVVTAASDGAIAATAAAQYLFS
ncbi:MAG: thioredoxin-disulfide reductase [Bacillota bacterium]